MTINTLVSNYKESAMRLDLIKVLGVTKPVNSVTINEKPYPNYIYNIPDQVFNKTFFLYFKSTILIKIDSAYLCS